jgi:hypothetical protein
MATESKKTDLSKDLNHDGIVDASDDRSRDLNRDGVIDSLDRQERDVNHDNVIDSTDRKQKVDANQTQNAVGTTLGWTKDDQSWKRPETSNTQSQSQSRRIGGV